MIAARPAPSFRLRRAWASAAVTRIYTVLPLALLTYGIGVEAGAGRGHALTAAAAIACAVAGGYAYNDLRDQRLDLRNRPRRPLVSGRLSERYVRHLVRALFGAAFLLALTTRSWRTAVFVAVLIASSRLYSDSVKRVPGLKNAFVALWCGLLPWGASLDAVTGTTALPAVAIVGLFILQKELLADVYDLDGDRAAGVRTIPGIAGPFPAMVLVALLNAALWTLVRIVVTVPVIPGLPAAATGVASVNVLASLAVLCRITPVTVRALLELQKLFLLGGCLALFALLSR